MIMDKLPVGMFAGMGATALRSLFSSNLPVWTGSWSTKAMPFGCRGT